MAGMRKKETQSARESILKAAEQLFSEQGFAGTSIAASGRIHIRTHA